MAEITIDGNRYRTGRLTPYQQLHVARRLAPLLTGAEALISAVMSEDDVDLRLALKQLAPVSEALAKMPDAEVEYVLDLCLGVVTRLDRDAWSLVLPTPGAPPMFQDITMSVMLQLAVAVIRENVESFFPGQGSTSATEAEPPAMVRRLVPR